MITYESFAASDIATLIVVGCKPVEEIKQDDTDVLKGMFVHFGSDGSYRMHLVEEDYVVPEYYNLQGKFRAWIKIYDDDGLVYDSSKEYNLFEVYRAGDMTIMIKQIKS